MLITPTEVRAGVTPKKLCILLKCIYCLDPFIRNILDGWGFPSLYDGF